MTYRMSGARVTLLPLVLPRTPVGDLEMAGKWPLTWGGRYWVRTSDLFGVKNVRAIFCAGQTVKRLMGSARTRHLTAVRDASSASRAPLCSHPEVPDGWPFISYDPTTYEPASPDRPSLTRRVLVAARESAALMPAAFIGAVLLLVLAAG